MQSNQDGAAEGGCDISSLLEMLALVPDPRKARGRQYLIGFLLGVTVVAVLAGAKGYSEIARRAADISQEMLRELGSPWDWHRNRYRWPSKTAIRNLLTGIDGNGMDRIVGKWLSENSGQAAESEWEITLDGKVMRGAWTSENEKVALFSAVTYPSAVTIAQVSVPDGTDETSQAAALLEDLDALLATGEETVLVTFDAAHTSRETAREVKKRPNFDYLMNVKGNRPWLLESVFGKIAEETRNPPADIMRERSRGQIRQWSCWTSDADGIKFPRASQIALITRKVLDLSGQCLSKELALMITSRPPGKMSAAQINQSTRNHWVIENKSHYIRDTAYREDHNQTWTGNGPHVLAIMRNLAIGLMRMKGMKAIKETSEWIAADRTRALKFMTT